MRFLVSLFVIFFLIGCGGGSGANDSSSTDSGNTENRNNPPILQLGDDQVVKEGDSVKIIANIQDENVNFGTLSWELLSEESIDLSINERTGTFIAPEPPNKSDSVIIEYKVSFVDEGGLKAEDYITIIVEKVNQFPSITFLSPTDVEELDSVVVDTEAIDSDGHIVSYLWSQVSGAVVALDDLTSDKLSFVAPVQDGEEPLVFNLKIIDDEGAETSKNVFISHSKALRISQISFDDSNFSSCVNEYAEEKKIVRAKELISLYCRDKDIVSTIGIRFLSELTQLNLILNDIKTIDLSENKKLTKLLLEGNEIEVFDGAGLDNLLYIDLTNNPLTKLELSDSVDLVTLNLFKVKLQSIELSQFKSLRYLSLYFYGENEISTLDISELTELRELTLSGTKIKEIDLSSNKKIVNLGLVGNKLETIDLSSLTSLDYLQISRNNLESIDLSANENLDWILIGYNKIKDISIDNNKKLSYLNIENNPLSQNTKDYLKALNGVNGLSISY